MADSQTFGIDRLAGRLVFAIFFTLVTISAAIWIPVQVSQDTKVPAFVTVLTVIFAIVAIVAWFRVINREKIVITRSRFEIKHGAHSDFFVPWSYVNSFEFIVKQNSTIYWQSDLNMAGWGKPNEKGYFFVNLGSAPNGEAVLNALEDLCPLKVKSNLRQSK